MPLKAYLPVLLLVATAVPAWPQVSFEVESIRPSPPGFNFSGDPFEVKANTVGDILDMLHGFDLFRVVGGPDWMRSDRYDIEAKSDRPLAVAHRQQAVMALLA
jgi:uncharacterized protein (TIGR03435 family)